MFLELNQIKKSYGTGENRIEVLKNINIKIEKRRMKLIFLQRMRKNIRLNREIPSN